MLHTIANAGTPLMWLTMGQLALGNIVIGLIEAIVVWWWNGLRVGGWDEPELYRVAVETPFTWWQPGPATVLPSGQVIYQLDDWLMLLDPATRRIATITRGRSPVAIPDVSLAPSPTATQPATQSASTLLPQAALP